MGNVKGRKQLGTDESHHQALLRNLARQLLMHQKIKTTQAKAEALQPLADKLVTLGKRGDLHARRQALSIVQDREVVHQLFSDIAGRYTERAGGYTRILKLGPRQGDAAPMAQIELV